VDHEFRSCHSGNPAQPETPESNQDMDSGQHPLKETP